MPPTPAPVPPKAYTAVKVIIFTFKDYPNALAEGIMLGRVLQSFGYEVEFVDVTELDLRPGESNALSSYRAKLWFRLRLQDLNNAQMPGSDMLTIFCYIGHGTVHNNGHLYTGNRSQPGLRFSLTQIQQFLRDEIHNDVLCYFCCCNGNVDGMAPLPSVRQHPDKIMETLADGQCIVYEERGWWGFGRRLVLNLLRMHGQKMPMKLNWAVDMSRHKICPWSKGFLRREFPKDGATKRIILPVFTSTLSEDEVSMLRMVRAVLEEHEAQALRDDETGFLAVDIDRARSFGWRK